jgi:hypothetical protein
VPPFSAGGKPLLYEKSVTLIHLGYEPSQVRLFSPVTLYVNDSVELKEIAKCGKIGVKEGVGRGISQISF